MDYNDNMSNANEVWEWQEKEYCLQKDSRIDTSHCLWDEVSQNEDSLLYMLEEQTPVKDCIDFGYNFSDTGCNTNKRSEECRDSSQFKRRRVLQFPSDSDTGIGYEQNSCYVKSKVTEDSLMGDVVTENLQWNSGFFDDEHVFGDESLEQFSEGWFTNCCNETEMQCTQNEMNEFIASNEQIDISEFYNVPPEMETDVVQQNPTPAPRRIFKSLLAGRKSLINTPMKLTTSVAYPFALIKPCGVQGDVTLKDINQRIHAPPLSRSKNRKDDDPSASYPTSAFSGKPVVVKTKIRTEGGKGSITIMRTKG